MVMQQELQQTQEYGFVQSMRVSARLVAANAMLVLSSQELQQAIEAELAANPALELLDVPACQVCGTALLGSICPRCIQRQKEGLPADVDGAGTSTADEYYEPRERLADDEVFDPLVRVATEQTLAERLLLDLGSALPEADRPIAEYLVGSLDDKGYLPLRPEEAADALGVDEERVRVVLRALQAQDPAGVGARNLRECLLLQIDRLESTGLTQPHARDIVSMYLTELGGHRFQLIARELRIPERAVVAAWEFVKAKLNPHPAQGIAGVTASDRDTRALYVRPDVIVARTPDGDFDVQVVESERFQLRLNPLYARLAAEARGTRSSLQPEERRHVDNHVYRAKAFVGNLQQRRKTLLAITRAIVSAQHAFLDHGVRVLAPLTRADVARIVGMHESTISRGTANKHVLLPNGQVVPYTHFFTPSLGIKDVIKELVEREGRPLTDSAIRDRLAEQGIHIARRTVAKYRLQLAILPSALR